MQAEMNFGKSEGRPGKRTSPPCCPVRVDRREKDEAPSRRPLRRDRYQDGGTVGRSPLRRIASFLKWRSIRVAMRAGRKSQAKPLRAFAAAAGSEDGATFRVLALELCEARVPRHAAPARIQSQDVG